ncbi:MAG: acetamidase/formamidase family protein [Thermofilaceae archaeon]
MRELVKITSSKVFYRFDPDIPPIASVKPCSLLEIQCVDALGNQIISESQSVEDIDWNQVNPATGPIYIEGAEKGDTLVVRILGIETGERGVVVTVPNEGVLSHLTKEARTRVCKVLGDFIEFMGLRLKARKMIGVIGVASPERPPTGIPGRHGGNLDTRLIAAGATVYLPVMFDGALLGMGDLHAVMGDGEVCVAACEVPGRVIAEVDVIKGLAPGWPIVETEDACYLLVSLEGLEKAVQAAVEETVKILSRALNLNWYDAYMLASLSVDLELSQLVDPRKTVRVKFPKTLMPAKRLLNAASP